MRTLLKTILYFGGMAAVAIALAHVIMGPASIPGSIPVNATMDSEDRFYAVMLLGVGIALIWSARGLDARWGVTAFLTSLFFVGGLARLVSLALVGRPNRFFQAMTLLELALPPAIFWLKYQVRTGPDTSEARLPSDKAS